MCLLKMVISVVQTLLDHAKYCVLTQDLWRTLSALFVLATENHYSLK